MNNRISVGKIPVIQYLNFLDNVYGQASVDSFEMRNALESNAIVRIQRSEVDNNSPMERIACEYVFQNDYQTGGYLATRQYSNGNTSNISSVFERYMGIQLEMNKESVEAIREI